MARPGFKQHWKFIRLVYLLNEPEPHALGYLEYLWDVGYQCGDPTLGDAIGVEAAAKYPGEPGKLLAALLGARLIDDLGDGLYAIHDLYDHAPDYVRKRMLRERERKEKGAERLHAFAPRSRATSAAWRETDLGGLNPDSRELGGLIPVSGDLVYPPAPAPAPFLGDESPKTPSCSEAENPASEPTATPRPVTPETASIEGCSLPGTGRHEHGRTETAPARGRNVGGGSPPVLVFPCRGPVGKREWGLSAGKLAEWAESYPGLDHAGEARKALQWVRDNPAKMKTHRGMAAFLGRWMMNAYERRGRVPLAPSVTRDQANEAAERQRQQLRREREEAAARIVERQARTATTLGDAQ